MKRKSISKVIFGAALVMLMTGSVLLSQSCENPDEPTGGGSTASETVETEAPGKTELKKPEYLESLEYTAGTVDKYELHADGGLIYNLLSKEAENTGVLNKYDGAPTKDVTVSADEFTAVFSLPADLTAYDVVPIRYRVAKTGDMGGAFTLEATAYEEDGRGGDGVFDLNIPGKMAVKYKYLGSVTGTFDADARTAIKANNKDKPSDSYPNYTTTELNPSGTVLAGDIVWLKFEVENTGNTVLDAEGIGNWNIYPVLYKKDSSGKWQQVGLTVNNYVRILDYFYPGEKEEFWLNFQIDWSAADSGKTPQNLGLVAGEYKVALNALYRAEFDYDADVNLYHGRTMSTYEYEFTVSNTPKDTEPSEIKLKLNSGNMALKSRTSWLHYHEEFMAVYEQHRKGLESEVTEGTLWLQVAPWTEYVTLKVIYDDPMKLKTARVDVNVETDSLHIVYDEDNINVIVNEDGYEEPVINIQGMPDMRANVQISPYPAETIISDYITMIECGCNVVNWQSISWLYDDNIYGSTGKQLASVYGDGMKFGLDLCRELNVKSLCIGQYPYGQYTMNLIYKWITGNTLSIATSTVGATAFNSSTYLDLGDPDLPEAVAAVLLWQRNRYGDIYWSDKTGVNVYTLEDTRGFARYEHQARYAIGSESKKAFQEWCADKYGTIEALNEAWGSDYRTFIEIDPEKDQPYSDSAFGRWYDYSNKNTPFYEWSPALIDFDFFRTENRIESYEKIVSIMREEDGGAAIQLRTEGSVFVSPGLDPNTTNPHYRQVIYSQLKGGAVAEKIVISDSVQSYADYVRMAFTPSEVRYLVRRSTENGIICMHLPQFHDMRDIAMNDKYGLDYTTRYNLTETTYGAYVHQLTAVYPWWKATYEEGGVPGVLWQDFQCNGFVTSTQIKEMKFFKQKIDEMLSDPAVKEKTKHEGDIYGEGVTGKNIFDGEFVASAVNEFLAENGLKRDELLPTSAEATAVMETVPYSAEGDGENKFGITEGICIVGEVDEKNEICRVMFMDGSTETLSYCGKTPVDGIVYEYRRESDYIALYDLSFFPSFGAENRGWVFSANAYSNSVYYGGTYYVTDDTVFCVRYSATEWRIFKGKDSFFADNKIVKGGYVYASDGTHIDVMLLVGDCDNIDRLPGAGKEQSSLFDPMLKGWDNGDIDLSLK